MRYLIIKTIKISRVRFWVYLWGSYILGYALGVTHLKQFTEINFIINLIYFTLPANLLIYAANDISDADTDQFNLNKKGKYEYKINLKDLSFIKITIFICIFISILLLFIEPDINQKILLLIFLFLSLGYSLKPLRFKSIPILDSTSNILYAIPGILGFYCSNQSLVNIKIIIIITCWCAAMHLFSAIVDIVPDKKANIKTSAVFFGKKRSLLITSFLWGIFSLYLIRSNSFGIFGYLSLIYPIIPLRIFLNKNLSIKKIYRFFPYINITLGGLSFLIVIIKILT